jgi:glycosyltransferase involved in cell wall biosynthesis
VTATVLVDAAGAMTGGGARFRTELYQHLARTGRDDIRLVGVGRRLKPAWLLRREMFRPPRGRRVALNNVSFIAPGGERWTRLGNALHFLTDDEAARLDPDLRVAMHRQAAVVHMTACRSDVLVTPSTAMAERVQRTLPGLASRVVPRLNPVSPDSIRTVQRDRAILCPVLFAPYKQMVERLTELLEAIEECGDPSVRVRVTADRAEVPEAMACQPRVDLVGRLGLEELRDLRSRSRAIYFPTGIESFGYPLAEARVSGQPVIARDTEQNREIAGPALCGFTPGDRDSLRHATMRALATDVQPDPAPFEPDAYFSWLLGPAR